ncbi:MAG: succinylglutamate desuccinylase/aspartoacylase family protein [Cyclobacteriaceae bacterium]
MELATKRNRKKVKINAKRVLGEYGEGKAGTTIICFCSIHGNEPAGTKAFRQVISDLKRFKPNFNGKIIGLHGNITACAAKERFIDKDLNRVWSEDRVLMLQEQYEDFPEEQVEDVEQKQLWALIENEINESQGPIVFLDLHTTSSESQAFISINDTLKNRFFAMQFPLPVVLGLEEYLEGTILSYINELGHIAIGIEAGQHDEHVSIENHESMIWLTLSFANCIDPLNIPKVNHHYQRLAKDMIDGKRIFEVRHRHALDNTTPFFMKPGYINFQRIKKNEVLAMDNKDSIKAPEKGRVFMPLYQKQGNDGFFVVREIKKFWLGVSAFLRRRNFHRFIQYLPGVGRYREMDHTIAVNRKIARWYVVELFHLLGFRRKIKEGNTIVFIRRPFDL